MDELRISNMVHSSDLAQIERQIESHRNKQMEFKLAAKHQIEMAEAEKRKSTLKLALNRMSSVLAQRSIGPAFYLITV